MKSIVIFCASSLGHDPVFEDQAVVVGQTLALKNIQLEYGGGRVGLMGAVANAALAAGGEVIGVIPEFLNTKEREHAGITKLITVDTMHDRKRIMNEYAEGIIALPGGFGTLEELFEMITWAQLGLHKKAVGILNIAGYYSHLIRFIDHMVEQGLLRAENRAMLLVADNIEELLEKMENYQAPAVSKWIHKNEL